VRVAAELALGRGQADEVQKLDRAGSGGGAPERAVQQQGFRDLVADGEDGVERRHRLLEDHRDSVAAQLSQGARVETDEVLALEQDAPAGDAARRLRDEAQEGKGRHRLAAARLADEAQALAWPQGEGHLLHHRPPAHGDGQVLDGEKGSAHAARQSSPPGIGSGTPVVVGRLKGRPRAERTAR
jgi:hypothetical protein